MSLIEIITLAISIISLVAVIYQSINLKLTIESQIYQSFITNSLEIDKVLVEHPHLRKYVYYNEEVNDNTENLDEIMSLIELIIDTTENVEVYKKYIPKSRRDGWLVFVEDMKKTSAYKYYMKKHFLWFEEK